MPEKFERDKEQVEFMLTLLHEIRAAIEKGQMSGLKLLDRLIDGVEKPWPDFISVWRFRPVTGFYTSCGANRLLLISARSSWK